MKDDFKSIIKKQIGAAKSIEPLDDKSYDLNLFLMENFTFINRGKLIALNKDKLESVLKSNSLIEYFDQHKNEMVFMCLDTKKSVGIKIKQHYKFIISEEGELSLYINCVKI